MVKINTPAFILLEIIIGIAIASMMGVALMNNFFQSNTMLQTMDDIFLRDRRTSILNHVVEKDISGMFIPQHIPVKDKKPTPQPTLDKQTAADKKKEADKQPKKLEKVFYAVHMADGNLKTLSFITTSVLSSYNAVKPRIARIVYRLEQIKEEKDAKKQAYKLLRQESDNLDFEAFKLDGAQKIRPFEVVDNVKKITCEYGIQVKKDKKVELKFLKEWSADDAPKNKNSEKEKEKPRFPDVMMLHVALWDAKKERDFITNITIPILADHAFTTTEQTSSEKVVAEKDEKSKKEGTGASGGVPPTTTPATPPAISGRAGVMLPVLPTGPMPRMPVLPAIPGVRPAGSGGG